VTSYIDADFFFLLFLLRAIDEITAIARMMPLFKALNPRDYAFA